MGNTKDTTAGTTVVNQTTTPTPTAEETAMNKLMLSQYQQLQPQQTQYISNAYNLANTLLTGGQLPGYLATTAGGINKNDIADQATSYAIKAMPGMQSLGVLDSGQAAKSISRGIASEIALPTAEYNSNLLLNLLNLATGQAAQGTQQFQGNQGMLANQLAGLRSITSNSTTNSKSTYTQNPFLKSFYSSLGSGLGGGIGGGIGTVGKGFLTPGGML